jgi:hypothetical protein
MVLYEQLKELVNSLEVDVNKYYNKNNKTAGVRVRKGCQDIKKICQDLRIDISNKNKNVTV